MSLAPTWGLNEFIDKRLSSLVGWAEKQGFKIEDFSRISGETPKRWKDAQTERNLVRNKKERISYGAY